MNDDGSSAELSPTRFAVAIDQIPLVSHHDALCLDVSELLIDIIN